MTPEPPTDRLDAAIPYRRETIGRSTRGRRLRVRIVGPDDAPLRVLVIAGQHGDERLAVAAVRRFTRTLRNAGALPADLQVASLRDANPDGRRRRRRRTAQGVDMNRDHVRLAAPETRALHAFIEQQRPHLILDVHTYPPRRKHLVARGLIHCQDVYLDAPTQPNVAAAAAGESAARLRSELIARLAAEGFRAARYTLVTKTQRVRHSTPDVVDARNSLALRFGVPTLLVEGRQCGAREERRRTLAALEATLVHSVDWADQNRAALLAPAATWPPGAKIVLRTEYRPAPRRCRLSFYDLQAGAIQEVELPDLYTPELRPVAHATLPAAYAVPSHLLAVVKVLARHGLTPQAVEAGREFAVESSEIDRLLRSRRAKRAPLDMIVRRTTERRGLDGYWLYPVAGASGALLGVLLEPESKYGLVRYPAMHLPLRAKTTFPILRVLNS